MTARRRCRLPRRGETGEDRRGRARLADFSRGRPRTTPRALRALPDWPKFENLLLGLADQSPFSGGWRGAIPPVCCASRQKAPDAALDEAPAPARGLPCAPIPRSPGDEPVAAGEAGNGADRRARRSLRRLRRGRGDARRLSRAADRFVATALRAALRLAGDKLALADRRDPERECGLVILALGKHGAQELNYSSDVDLVVFYDRAVAGARRRAGRARPMPCG